jgi:hypothetical protein
MQTHVLQDAKPVDSVEEAASLELTAAIVVCAHKWLSVSDKLLSKTGCDKRII